MSEQQRIFLAVALCLGIMLLWPFIIGKEEQKPKPAAQKTEEPSTKQAGTPSAADSVPAEPTTRPTTETAEAQSDAAVEAIEESVKSFSTPLLHGEVSNVQASLTSLELLTYNERVAEEDEDKEDVEPKPVSLVTAERNGRKRQAQIEWDLGSVAAPALAWVDDEAGLVMRGVSADGVQTRVQIVAREDVYALDYKLSLENSSDRVIPVAAKVTLSLDPGPAKEKSGWFSPPVNQVNALCAMAEDVERQERKEVAEDGPWTTPNPALWSGIDRQYFVMALLPEKAPAICTMAVKDKILLVDFAFVSQSVSPGEKWERSFTLFLGPKRNESLEAVSSSLKEVIDYSIWGIPLGFLARPMVFLLNVFHGWTSSWGMAIMMLTLLVKLLLFPVTYKSSISMRKMQLLKPQLEKLKKQFEGDRERQQVEQMKLFKEKGVNPLGGCLPMLLQMPVWFALYRTLWTAVDLYQQPFLWLVDLTAKEPLPLMAVGVGGLMFLQQKLMPTAVDSQQAKMMKYFMPIMMLVFMIALPSGLVLYILFNSILTIFQQLVINKRTPQLDGSTAVTRRPATRTR